MDVAQAFYLFGTVIAVFVSFLFFQLGELLDLNHSYETHGASYDAPAASRWGRAMSDLVKLKFGAR